MEPARPAAANLVSHRGFGERIVAGGKKPQAFPRKGVRIISGAPLPTPVELAMCQNTDMPIVGLCRG